MEHDLIIAAAEKDLATLDAQRHEIANFLDRYRRYKGMAASVNAAPLSADTNDATETARRSAPADTVMSAVHDILSKRKDALTLTAIFEALLERGVMIGGKTPSRTSARSSAPTLK